MSKGEGPGKETSPATRHIEVTDISDEDIYEAMKDIPGYLDVTLDDLKEIYLSAYRYARARLTRPIEAGEIMTRKVVFTDPRSSLHDVASLLARHKISGLPVIEDGKVVGVISEKDLLTLLGVDSLMGFLANFFEGKGCVVQTLATKVVGEVMASPVITVTERTTVAQIVAVFTARRINRVPVLNEAGTMVGIVTRGDIMKAHLGVS